LTTVNARYTIRHHVMAPCFFTISNMHALSPTLETDVSDPPFLARRRAHLRELVGRSIAVPGGDAPGRYAAPSVARRRAVHERALGAGTRTAR
jgi:hypothetical protein